MTGTEAPARQRDRILRAVAPGLLLAATIVVLAFSAEIAQLGLRAVSAVSAGLAAAALLAVAVVQRGRFASGAFLYLVIFLLFHLGLTSLWVLTGDGDVFAVPSLRGWLSRDSTRSAVLLSGCAAAAFALGVAATSNRPGPSRGGVKIKDAHLRRWLAGTGAVVLFGSVVAWFTSVVTTAGFSILWAPYAQLLEQTAGSGAVPWAYAGIGLGLSLVAIGPPGRLRATAFVSFAVFAIVALPLGLRGEVLFPLCGAVAVLAARRRVRLRWAAACGLAALVAIAALGEVRQLGLEGVREGTVTANPLDAVAEMGSSLRPVSEVVGWHQSGEPLLLGGSYVAPFQRMATGVLGIRSTPGTEDQRLLNVVISQRVGLIGFSPVAEGHRNFGAVGAVGALFVTGLLLGWLDARSARAIDQALFAAVYVPVLIQVRNSFAAVPGQVLVGLVIVLASVLICRHRQTGVEHRAQPA